jgi:hypothetical protein
MSTTTDAVDTALAALATAVQNDIAARGGVCHPALPGLLYSKSKQMHSAIAVSFSNSATRYEGTAPEYRSFTSIAG